MLSASTIFAKHVSIHPHRLQNLACPLQILPTDAVPVKERLQQNDPVTAPAAGLTICENVLLDPAHGLHTVAGRSLGQVYCDLNAFDALHRLLSLLRLARSRATSRLPRGIWLGDPYLKNYYHWLIEIAPRLALLDRQDDLHDWPILLPESAPRFIHDGLAALGLDDRIMLLPPRRYRVDEMILLDCLSLGGEPNVREEATFWRERLGLATSPWPDTRSGKRLFLVRPQDTKRAFINETAIRDALADLDLSFVQPEEWSWHEQIERFQQASVVIAAHGAGLANIAFLRPGAQVIEIADPPSVHPCYSVLARHLGCPTTFILGRSCGQTIDVDPALIRSALLNDQSIAPS